MIRSSFANFTTARLAIQANQSALGIVGQNMGNAKTTGYTRQRLDQISLNSTNAYSIYEADPTAHIGSGVWITGVSQIRDPFLDTRYRMEMGSLGSVDKRLSVLGEIGDVIDETDRDAVKAQLEDFESQLNTLMNANGNTGDGMIRSSATTLAGLFRSYSDGLDKVQSDLVISTENDVNNLNGILNQIQKMNVTIKNAQVHGNPALELQDNRNLLIDQLSTYTNIKVSYSTSISLSGIAVDSLKIDMIGNSDSGIQTMNLIDDVDAPAQFSFNPPRNDGDGYQISLKDSMGSVHQDVSSNKGTLTTSIDFLNDSGEFGGVPTTNRGVGYYKSAIDNMANKLATVFNDLNTVNEDGKSLGGPLFGTNDGSDVITAGNLTISQGWQNGTVKILRSRNTKEDVTGDNSNVINMVNALKNPQTFLAPDGSLSFKGTFRECFDNIVNMQAMDENSTTTTYKNCLSITNKLAESKDSVSGVNMDEEAMNMMQYNDALNAASRLMTTLDEALDTIINSMGIVGR